MSEPEDLRKVEPAKSKPRRVHTPTVLQMEAVECGAAALASVLAYYGRWVPLEKLRIQCGVSRDGSSAGNLMAAARAYGLKAQGKRLQPKDLGKYTFPLIVHWEFDHFMVVEGTDSSGVFLNDPSQGPRKLPWKEFEAGFAGVAMVFEKSSQFKPGGQPPSVIRALRKRLKGSEAALVYVVIVSVLLVLPGLALPTFVRTFVDKVLVGGLDGWLRPLIRGLALSAVLSGVLTAMQQYTLRAMETRLSLTSSSKFFWHVLRLPMDFYAQRYAGDVGSRVALNDHVAKLLSGQLATACLNMIVIALYAALMFTYDVSLTVVSIVIAAVNLLVLSLVSRKRRDGNALVMQEEGKLMGMASGGLQIIETLKATGTESNFFARWAGQDAKVLNAQQRLGVYTQILTVVPSFLTMLNTALILWIGAGRVIDGRMTLGMLVAFQTLATSFMTPVTQLVGLGTALQEVNGSLLRLDDVLRYEIDPKLEDEAPVNSEQPARLTGKVELRDVTFGYSPLAPPLIQGLNLTLNPGDRVAIVGGTGSGKSTLARLVSGLNHPWDGEILFDDRPIASIPRHILTDSIAHVDQEIALFEGTLRENLTLWEKDISQANLVRAARDAAIHDGIMNRENGYSTAVAEGGANFSGGQRQRLEIARTLVGDPTILVLDEATSALDPIVEGMIDNHLRRRGCTCLIIAHRLSTIRDCSEIIVLEQGQVVERGTHTEMIGHDGPYRRLIQAELTSEPEADIRPNEKPAPIEEKAPELGEEWEKRTSYLLGPDTAGFVKKGFVDVFAVPLPVGSRRFLARFKEGQAFFGVPQDAEMSLVGVPGSQSVVVDVRDANPEGWMAAIGKAGEVQPQENLSKFQGTLLQALKDLREHKVESDLARAERRQKEGDAAVTGALHALASIMGTPQEVTFQDEEPLLAAARLVARANGISVTAPKHISESESEALEDIARASHFRHRRVILRSDWWSYDNGPLLGFRAGNPAPSRKVSESKVASAQRATYTGAQDERPSLAEARGGASSVDLVAEDDSTEPSLGAPVALLPRSPNRYDCVDPVEKTRAKVSTKSDFSPIAYQFYRPLPNLVLNARALLKFALRGCRRDLVTMGVMGLLAGLLGMALPVVTGFLVNQVIPSADRQQVLIMGMLLLVITVSAALFEFTRAIAVQRIEGKMDGAVQPAIWDRILALPTSFFREYSAGDLASRAMTIESIRETVTGATVSAVLGAIFSVFSLGLMFYYDASLAGLAMIPIGVLVAFTVVAGLMQVRLERKLLHVQGRISGLVLQLLDGISKIRIAGAEGRAFARWGKEFAEQKELSWRQLGVTNLTSVVNSTFGMIGAIVLFLGVALPPKGAARLSTGDFMAFYAAFGQFAGALLALSSSLTSTLSVLPMFERARPILEALPEISEIKTHPGKLKGEIELSHVNFSYTQGGPQVLSDVSVRAGVGEFVAIVGASGSGKSTLFRHLLGFERPDSGAIYFDGQDLQDVDLSAVRRQMGVVLQDSKLMPGDILQNVLGSSGRTPQDALDALKSAGMQKDLEQMPMGLHTVVMEGGGAFSGGQRQRLLIARAIVGKPRILLFDEATSALDSETQESVTRNLESLKVTRIVIAHRLSTIRNADRIYVMDAGRIVQVGTFDELMKQGGTFEKLVRPQTIS